MKRLATVICIMLLAGASYAGPPLDGVYDSVDLGGLVWTGRYTEGWDAGGNATSAGTTINAESWDGSTLGTQWRYWCGTETADATIMTDFVNPTTGNGNRTYMKTFVGGYIWLNGSGPWANGDPDYFGVIDQYAEFETVQYVNWVPVAAVTNVQAIAHFDEYPNQCMTFYIGNGTRMASTEVGESILPDYPELLDTDCNATRTEGACWDFTSVTLTITGCETDARDTSWGSIKSIYTD